MSQNGSALQRILEGCALALVMLGMAALAYLAPGETIPVVQFVLMVAYPLILIAHVGIRPLRRGICKHWAVVMLFLGYQLAFVVVDPTANWWSDHYHRYIGPVPHGIMGTIMAGTF